MRVILVLNTDGTFYQQLHRWEPLDVEAIKSELADKKTDYIVTDISKLPYLDINIETDIIWYTSHQVPEKREYIKDIIGALYLKNQQYKLVPSYELLLCHENKGMQELIKLNKGIDSLNGVYYNTLNEGLANTFPAILKYPEGAGSSTVFLVKDKDEYAKKINEFLGLSLTRYLKKVRLAYKRGKEKAQSYSTYFGGSKRHIIQPFVSGLEYDYKVLVFFNHVYVLKRFTRKNDFRASGSGLFIFDEKAPDEILDFSYNIYNKLANPFISLDVCADAENSYLIEFQGVSFGPSTMMKSNYCYIKNGSKWDYVKKDETLEQAFVYSILNNGFFKSN